jgi:hypothetical protein
MGSIEQPRALPMATDSEALDDDDDDADGVAIDGPKVTTVSRSPVVVDGIEMADVVGAVRERLVAALQGQDMVRSTEIAKQVYGNASESTMSKLRVRLAQYKAQGLVETPRRGFWRLR